MIEERIKYFTAFLRFVFKQYGQDRCSSIAAELTVTSLLALVPLTAVIFGLFAFVPSFQSLGEQIQNLLFENFVPSTGETVQIYINEFVGKTRGLSGIGSLMLLLTALLMMRTIDTSFNKIWDAKSNKSFIRTFLVYWAVLTLGPILLGSSLFITSYIKSLPLISDVVASHSRWFSWGLPFLMELVAFSVVFYLIPNRKIYLKHALSSGAITAVLFELAKSGFGVFVTSFSTYQVIFGALAAVPLFLIWIYLTWSLLLLGAEFCHGMEAFDIEREKSKEHGFIEVVNLILILSDYQGRGEVLTEEKLRLVSRKGKRASNVEWLELMVEAGLVAKTQDLGYCLLKNAQDIDYLAIYSIAGNQIPSEEQIDQTHLPKPIKQALIGFVQQLNQMLKCHPVIEDHPKKVHD